MIYAWRLPIGLMVFMVTVTLCAMEPEKKGKDRVPSLQVLGMREIIPTITASEMITLFVGERPSMQPLLLLPTELFPEFLYLMIFKNAEMWLFEKKDILSKLQTKMESDLEKRDTKVIQENQSRRDIKHLIDFFAKVMKSLNFKSDNHQKFLTCGVNSKIGNRFSNTLLFHAADGDEKYRNEKKIIPIPPSEVGVRFLVQYGANCNDLSSAKTPFALGCTKFSPDTISFMIEKGALINHRNVNPLYEAAMALRADNVTVLLKSGAKGSDQMFCNKVQKLVPVITCLEKAQLSQEKQPQLKKIIDTIKEHKPSSASPSGEVRSALKKPKY